MSLSIRLLAENQKQGKAIATALAKHDYQVTTGLRKGAKACTVGVWIFEESLDLPRSKIGYHLKCEYPLIFSRSSTCKPFQVAAFRKGAYAHLSLSECGGKAGKEALLIKDCIEDVLYMASTMGKGPVEKRQWAESVTNDLNLGIAVIDRNYHIWYRNRAHEEIAGTVEKSCSLCWAAYHGLTSETEPCGNCPSKHLFDENSMEPSEPRPMVIGFEPDTDQRPPRPTEVRAIPIYDKRRKRTVGSIEVVRDISSQLEEKTDPDITEWMERILEAIFIGPKRFTRARLFLLSPNDKYLIGFAAVGEPQPSAPIKSLQVPVKTGDPSIPSPLSDVPRVVHASEFGENMPRYCNLFAKEDAPYWGDLPIKNNKGELLGKVVVDRWSKNEQDQKIESEDLESSDKGLDLISRIVVQARSLKRAKGRIAVADATQNFMDQAKSASASAATGDSLNALMDAAVKVPGVVSCLIRRLVELDNGKRVFRAVRGRGTIGGDGAEGNKGAKKPYEGAYYKHCTKDLPVDTSNVTGVVYENPSSRWPAVLPAFERLQIKEDSIDDIEPNGHREEIKRIRFLGTFPIGPNRSEIGSLYFCAQAENYEVFEHESLRLLTGAADLTLALGQFNQDISDCFLATMELHDVDTAIHSERVAFIARILAEEIDDANPQHAYIAGCLHDIGKIGLTRDLLRGHTRLTTPEMWYVKAHVEVGSEVLKQVSHLEDARIAVGEHHMWFNGKGGYPESREKQPKISPLGRILAVADCLEAMTSKTRYYQEPTDINEALRTCPGIT